MRDRSSDVSAAYRKLTRVDTEGEKLIGFWVWEYILKYTSDVSLIRELTKSLSFPKDVPRLKQMILIKELSFQVSKDLDIKKTLDILEALQHSFEDPNSSAGVESENVVLSKRFKASSSEAPKARDLHENTSPELSDDAGEECVWKELQQPTLELKEDLRKLLQGDAENGEVMVIESKLSALIKNAWALFGPMFLERTESAVINGRYKPQGVSIPWPLASGKKNTGTVDDTGAKPRNEEVIDECGVELQKDVNGRNQDLERTRQALADSRAELGKLVKDPLPALLRQQQPDGTTEVLRSKRDLLEPHPSAQAQVWNEDNDEIEESPSHSTPSASKRIRLPPIHSPERRTVPPRKPTAGEPSLATPGGGVKHRRQKKKWSEEEVETLKSEVNKYGKGRWKIILQKNKDVFHGRTEVDIKDKWRNLEKYNFV